MPPPTDGLRPRGPIGRDAGSPQGPPRGPAGKDAVPPAKDKQPQAVKRLTMPTPGADGSTKCLQAPKWGLFGAGGPATKDIKQGLIANCPLASLLAALANTPGGRQHIKNMVAEKPGNVATAVKHVASELSGDCKLKGNAIMTNRYFTVELEGQTREVSEVLYTDDGDGDTWSLRYMSSPTEVLWPAIVEKAYAVKEGGYKELDSASGKRLTLNQIWKVVAGKSPGGFSVDAKTPEATIRGVVANASQIPAVAASRRGAKVLIGWHGHAIVGASGSSIKVYDPMRARELIVTMKVFREDVEAVLHSPD